MIPQSQIPGALLAERIMASNISQHGNTDQSENNVNLDIAQILVAEWKWFEVQSIHNRVAAPSQNRDGGCYNLPLVWNNLL